MLNRITETLSFQTQALALRSERQRLLASNIANADTPGYQARDMNFAKTLRDINSPIVNSKANLSTTQVNHIAQKAQGLRDTDLLYATPSQNNVDNNSVDMDRERASFADNSVKYEATLRFINGQVRSLLDAMKSQNGI